MKTNAKTVNTPKRKPSALGLAILGAEITADATQSENGGWALSHIQKLYRIEAQLKDKAPEEKQHLRAERATPLLDQFKVWLEKSARQVPPKSALGKAIHYSPRQWPTLIRCLDDGQLNIDNNRAERAVKPLVIWRKNWLFSNTAKGAQASAVLYSLVETAKGNGLASFDYPM